jgi:hypothetical protein
MTDRSRVESERNAPFGSISSTNRRVPHISLVFREMWDSTALGPNLSQRGEFCSLRDLVISAVAYYEERARGTPCLMFGMTYHSALSLRVKINADVRRHIHGLTVANKRLVAPEPHRVRSLGFQRTIS